MCGLLLCDWCCAAHPCLLHADRRLSAPLLHPLLWAAIGGGVMAWSFLFDGFADLRTYMRPSKPAA